LAAQMAINISKTVKNDLPCTMHHSFRVPQN